MSHPGQSLFIRVLKPIIASQPCKERDQYANSDEEAERNHPYPQPIAFVLFLQPRLAIVRSAYHASFENGDSGMVEEDVRVSELWPR